MSCSGQLKTISYICIRLNLKVLFEYVLIHIFVYQISQANIIIDPVDSVAISQLHYIIQKQSCSTIDIYTRLNLKVLFEYIFIYIFVYQISQANIILDPVDSVAINQKLLYDTKTILLSNCMYQIGFESFILVHFDSYICLPNISS